MIFLRYCSTTRYLDSIFTRYGGQCDSRTDKQDLLHRIIDRKRRTLSFLDISPIECFLKEPFLSYKILYEEYFFEWKTLLKECFSRNKFCTHGRGSDNSSIENFMKGEFL